MSNWFRSKDLIESVVDLQEMFSAHKEDSHKNSEYLINLHWNEHQETFVYDDQQIRDQDYDRLCEQLMKHSTYTRDKSWNLNVKELPQSLTSKEKQK